MESQLDRTWNEEQAASRTTFIVVLGGCLTAYEAAPCTTVTDMRRTLWNDPEEAQVQKTRAQKLRRKKH
jgi:hypothetical protein